MRKKTFVILFVGALLIDLLLTPLLGASYWMPIVSLAVLPALFLFSAPPLSLIFLASETILLWLTSGINLGIGIFSLGLLYFIESWALPKFLHTTTWQALVVSALALPPTLIILATLSTLLTQEMFSPSARNIVVAVLTTLIALGILFMVRKNHV